MQKRHVSLCSPLSRVVNLERIFARMSLVAFLSIGSAHLSANTDVVCSSLSVCQTSMKIM